MEFEKLIKNFTIAAVVIVLVTAMTAAAFTVILKGEYNTNGKKPDVVGKSYEVDLDFLKNIMN